MMFFYISFRSYIFCYIHKQNFVSFQYYLRCINVRESYLSKKSPGKPSFSESFALLSPRINKPILWLGRVDNRGIINKIRAALIKFCPEWDRLVLACKNKNRKFVVLRSLGVDGLNSSLCGFYIMQHYVTWRHNTISPEHSFKK